MATWQQVVLSKWLVGLNKSWQQPITTFNCRSCNQLEFLVRRNGSFHFVQLLASRPLAITCLLATLVLISGLAGSKQDPPPEEDTRETAQAGSNSSGSPAPSGSAATGSDSISDDTAPRVAWESTYQPRELPPEDAEVVSITYAEWKETLGVGVEDSVIEEYADKWVDLEVKVERFRVCEGKPKGSLLTEIVVSEPTPEGRSSDYGEILITMAPGERAWEKVSHGDVIVVRGAVCDEFGMGKLIACRIVEPGEPMNSYTVGEVFAEYESDPEYFIKNNNDAQLLVTGRFVGFMYPPDVDLDGPGVHDWLCLEGEDGRRLYMAYYRLSHSFDDVEEGDELTLIAQLIRLYSPREPVDSALESALNVTPFLTTQE